MNTQVQTFFNKLIKRGGFKMIETNDKEVKMINDCLLRELAWSELREIVDLVKDSRLVIDTSKEIERPHRYDDLQCDEYSIDDIGYMELSMYLAYIEKCVGSVIYCYDENDNEYTFISYAELDEAYSEISSKYDNIEIDMIY